MILQAQKNGAKLIVVDPRRTPEAEKADMWLPIRPGTDVALMLGWLRIIIEENLYDTDFVANWTIGFEDLKAAVAEYTPEKVAEITWLAPEQVVSSARCYATTKPAMITWGFGLDKQGVNATQAARARCCLRAISGNLDIQGGEPLGWNAPVGRIIDDEAIEFNAALSMEQRAKQLGADQYPFFGFPGWSRNREANRRLPLEYMHPPHADMTCVAHARAVFDAMITAKPYAVTAAISVASNPLLSLPNVRHTYQALKQLALYVVGEYYLTPSAALADYVFPICSTVETTELWLTPMFCLACPRGVDPLYERRNTYDFWRGLALRLGQNDHWPWETVDDVWNYRLAPVELTFDQLLPVYREPPHSPLGDSKLAQSFPLVLISGSRFMPMYHSEQRQIQAARKKRPDPLVTLHPDTAKALDLTEGEWVKVESVQGSIRMRLADGRC
jgi:anaerobic selenocysteine-containing dehydrogenase